MRHALPLALALLCAAPAAAQAPEFAALLDSLRALPPEPSRMPTWPAGPLSPADIETIRRMPDPYPLRHPREVPCPPDAYPRHPSRHVAFTISVHCYGPAEG